MGPRVAIGGVSIAVIDRKLPFCGIRSWVDEVERALEGRLCSLADAEIVLFPEAKIASRNAQVIEALLSESKLLVTGFHGLHAPLSRFQKLQEALLTRADRLWATRRESAPVPVDVELPYIPFSAALRPVQGSTNVVLMTGRLTTAKGQVHLAHVADRLRGRVVLAGDSNMSYDRALWLHLKRGVPFTSRPALPLHEAPRANEPWTVGEVTSEGRYANVYEVFARTNPRVHVNLTSRRFSPGHLEYTTLEALAAGIRCVVPKHAVEGLDYTLGDSLVTVDETDEDAIADTLNGCLARTRPPRDTAAILELHDPAAYVERLLG
jgi:glycosyltransferase involved in cell wall biosynthesis